jgi:hypothetical protein
MGSLNALIVLTSTLTLAMQAPEPTDPSLTVAEYQQKGVPAPERFWTSRDYEAVFQALKKIKSEQPGALPRKASKRSGPVFRRLVSLQNIEHLQQENLPLNVRLGESLGILSQYNQIYFLYVDLRPNGKQPYGAETLELALYYGHLFELVLTTAEKFIATLPEQQKAEPARRNGWNQMKSGLGTGVSGMLTMLNERDQYDGRDLDDFATRLPAVVPPIWKWIDESVRREILTKIEETSTQTPRPTIRSQMTKLGEQLKKMKSPPRDPFGAAAAGNS